MIKSNLTLKDRLGFFSSQWVQHSASQFLERQTDMRIVAVDGDTVGSVNVHRAVILPLCPLLCIMEKDVTKEDPLVILPGISLELLQSFVGIVYRGSTPLTQVVTMDSLLLLMRSFGLDMPADRLVVTRERVEDEVQIIGFKNMFGLEITDKTINSSFVKTTTQSYDPFIGCAHLNDAGYDDKFHFKKTPLWVLAYSYT